MGCTVTELTRGADPTIKDDTGLQLGLGLWPKRVLGVKAAARLGLAGSSELQAPPGATPEDNAQHNGHHDLAESLRGQAVFSAL